MNNSLRARTVGNQLRQKIRSTQRLASGPTWKRRLTDLVLGAAVAIAPLAGSGCTGGRATVDYLGKSNNQYYEAIATEIDHPQLLTETASQVALTEPPHTIHDVQTSEIWDLPLSEAIRLALANNEVFRTNGTFLGGGAVLAGSDATTATFDSAIQETNVTIGQRGVEAALADFDTQFTTRLTWGRKESLQNNALVSGGFGAGGIPGAATTGPLFESVDETANFSGGLSKVFANGGQIQLQHNIAYSGTNQPIVLFPSSYNGSASLSYRQPLLAGAGTEFTRIAGPIAQNFGGLGPQAGGFFGGGGTGGGLGQTLQFSGVSNGVVIARINNDIELADFEQAIRDQLRDVENVYWDLYQAYRAYDTAVTQRNASLETWRIAKIRRDLEADILPAEEAQARDQYFASRAQSETARSQIFEVETRLRRLLNLPVSDGRIIRPADEPVTAELLPDWYACLGEAMAHRVELRRQKWNIKSLQLQKRASKSLLRPRLDFVSGYQVNGFGDKLLGYDDPKGGNFYETLGSNDQTGWQLGFEFSVPIGNRLAYSQDRNLELRLSKAARVLAVAEQEISQELANAFQELTRTRATMQSQFARREAAIENVALLEPLLEEGQITLDELLRAQARRGDAESAYFTAVVSYNQAIINLQYRKGTLLEYDNVLLAEGAWSPGAHFDANRRARGRGAALPAERTTLEPQPFAGPYPAGAAGFASPAARTVESSGHSLSVPGDEPAILPEPVEESDSSQRQDESELQRDDDRPASEDDGEGNREKKGGPTLGTISRSLRWRTSPVQTVRPVAADDRDLGVSPFGR